MIPAPVTRTMMTAAVSPAQRNRKKVISKYCCFTKCKSNSTSGVSFKRIQCIPKLPSANASKAQIITHRIKSGLRKEQLVRCGIDKNDKRKDLRFCEHHFSDKTKRLMEKIERNGKKYQSVIY